MVTTPDAHIDEAKRLIASTAGTWSAETKTQFATRALAHIAMATYLKQYGEAG